MSVVAMPVAAPKKSARQAPRPALRLVPAGSDAVDLRPGLVAGSSAGSAMAPEVAGGARSDAPRGAALPLRLTRRGRLLRTLAAFAVLSLLACLAVGRLSAPGPLVADRAVTVAPGQTLTQIAYEQLPQRPVAEGVALLRELNKMNSTQVVAGQNVLIPAL